MTKTPQAQVFDAMVIIDGPEGFTAEEFACRQVAELALATGLITCNVDVNALYVAPDAEDFRSLHVGRWISAMMGAGDAAQAALDRGNLWANGHVTLNNAADVAQGLVSVQVVVFALAQTLGIDVAALAVERANKLAAQALGT